MKPLLNLILLVFVSLFLMEYCESKKEPYEEGMHSTYSIKYENGFVYKTLGQKRGTILVLNSDGTPLKCGHKIY